jgi:hypothetical protein
MRVRAEIARAGTRSGKGAASAAKGRAVPRRKPLEFRSKPQCDSMSELVPIPLVLCKSHHPFDKLRAGSCKGRKDAAPAHVSHDSKAQWACVPSHLSPVLLNGH